MRSIFIMLLFLNSNPYAQAANDTEEFCKHSAGRYKDINGNTSCLHDYAEKYTEVAQSWSAGSSRIRTACREMATEIVQELKDKAQNTCAGGAVYAQIDLYKEEIEDEGVHKSVPLSDTGDCAVRKSGIFQRALSMYGTMYCSKGLKMDDLSVNFNRHRANCEGIRAKLKPSRSGRQSNSLQYALYTGGRYHDISTRPYTCTATINDRSHKASDLQKELDRLILERAYIAQKKKSDRSLMNLSGEDYVRLLRIGEDDAELILRRVQRMSETTKNLRQQAISEELLPQMQKEYNELIANPIPENCTVLLQSPKFDGAPHTLCSCTNSSCTFSSTPPLPTRPGHTDTQTTLKQRNAQ